MSRIDFNQTGGFRLETETLDTMQTNYNIYSAFGEIVGKRAIIKGCEEIGNTVSDGVVYIGGELLNFKGGTKQTNVVIRQEVQKIVFEDGEEKDTYYTRWVEFGVGTEAIPWEELERFSIHKGIHKEIKWVGRDVTNEDLPPNWYIANGQNGTDNLLGRMIVGRDPSQAEFNTVGEKGGAKTHTLTINEMPSHSHSLSIGTHHRSFGGASGSDKPYKTGATEYSTLNTESKGGNQPHNNLPPYIVMIPIQYIEK